MWVCIVCPWGTQFIGTLVVIWSVSKKHHGQANGCVRHPILQGQVTADGKIHIQDEISFILFDVQYQIDFRFLKEKAVDPT